MASVALAHRRKAERRSLSRKERVRLSVKSAAYRTPVETRRAERHASPKHTTTYGIRAGARRSATLLNLAVPVGRFGAR